MAYPEALRESIERVRSTLHVMDSKSAGLSSEAVEELKRSVDDLRRGVWAILTSRHSGSYEEFLARIRVRRATESCEELLAELYAGTLDAETPGLFSFFASLSEVMKVHRLTHNE